MSNTDDELAGYEKSCEDPGRTSALLKTRKSKNLNNLLESAQRRAANNHEAYQIIKGNLELAEDRIATLRRRYEGAKAPHTLASKGKGKKNKKAAQGSSTQTESVDVANGTEAAVATEAQKSEQETSHNPTIETVESAEKLVQTTEAEAQAIEAQAAGAAEAEEVQPEIASAVEVETNAVLQPQTDSLQTDALQTDAPQSTESAQETAPASDEADGTGGSG